MTRFIDTNRDHFGSEAIGHVLHETECGFITYRAAKTRPASARALRDQLLIPEIERVPAQKYSVDGARTMWHAMRRAGWVLGRDQVVRLMRSAGLHGVRPSRKPVTARPLSRIIARTWSSATSRLRPGISAGS